MGAQAVDSGRQIRVLFIIGHTISGKTLSRHRQGEEEYRAPRRLAFHPHPALVGLGYSLYDREPQARACGAVRGGMGAAETLEDSFPF